MPVIVMEIVRKEKHPNADTLFVYQMNDGYKNHQIVANSTNVYDVGERAVVAKSGSRLKDGLVIIKEEVRGVVSNGMALSKTSDAVGTDLTDQFCLSVYHVSWPSIESFFNICKKTVAQNKWVYYASKIKLDGTCAGVQILSSGEILIQSRTEFITPEKDNAGFARWVTENKDYFNSIDHASKNKPMTIFGEWCGSGIQKRCSVCQIGKKIFAVFAIQYGDYLDVNPDSIRKVLPNHKDVYVIPFHKFIGIDFTNKDAMQTSVDEINGWVSDVEKCDPFIKDNFNIEGLGEGIVLYPLVISGDGKKNEPYVDKNMIHIDDYTDFTFKAKSEAHKAVNTKKPVQINPETAASIEEFTNLFVTENRLNQFGDKFECSMKETGNFLKAFSSDVEKESKAELEASHLTWKEVANAVSAKARVWWQGKVNKI